MRFQALHRFTDKLPLVTYKENCPSLGTDTETAICAGVQQGVFYEIESYIRHFKQQYPDVLIFLTGGDGFFLAEKLKNSIFAEENLVLIGLNQILENLT
jgi:type III pantothenate kinase